MSRQYVIAIEGGSKELRDAITRRLAGAGYGYWHWMEDVWLVSGVPDDVTPQTMSEWLEKTPYFANTHCLIIRVGTPTSYWGRNVKDSWEWMSKNWK